VGVTREQNPKECLGFELEPGTILPPLCPLCGDRGVLPVDVPLPGAQGSLTAYYCEICHAAERRESTVLFSLSMAASIAAAAGVGISITKLRESWFDLAPLWLGVVGLIAGVGMQVDRRRRKLRPFTAVTPNGKWVLYLPALGGRSALGASLGARAVPLSDARSPITVGAVWLLLSPLVAMALPVGFTYFYLRSKVMVLVPEDDNIFLMDQRMVGVVPSFRHEESSGGLTGRWISGRRHLELANPDGSTRLEQWAWLEPDASYIFGTMPHDLCLFEERQEYGPSGSRSLARVSGGPLYKLENDTHLYFEGPPSPEMAQSRGGSLVAVRLLPCGDPSKRSTADSP
jgi:hypothetical protein